MTNTKREIGNLKLFTGNANPELAQEIAEYLGVKLGAAKVKHFSDGEISLIIDESVRGCDAYIIQPTCSPVNDNLMELLIAIDACKRASAQSITAVTPYYGYARQDRKAKPREPITSKLVASMLEKAGINHIIVCDLHAPQIQGFFDCPVDDLSAVPMFGKYFRDKLKDKEVVMCACSNKEMYQIQQAVKEVDPSSFLIILESNEVHGEGFHMLKIGEAQK